MVFVVVGNFVYDINATPEGNIAELRGIDSAESYPWNVVVPSTITVSAVIYNVISIFEYGLANSSQIVSVVIPNSVTNLGQYVFSNNPNITSVTFPSTITRLPGGAYMGTSIINVGESLVPSTITEFGSAVFQNCLNLESITIPNSLTSMGGYVFNNCPQLKSLVIPNSVAFNYQGGICANCTSLTSVTIPSSWTEIYAEFFTACSSLKSFTCSPNVTSLGMNSFSGCSSLTEITLNNVNNLAGGVFSGCSSLTSINLDKILNIDGYVFAGCSSLRSVNLTNMTTPQINNVLFYGCSSLTHVILPNSIIGINSEAFYGTGLTSITIPPNVTYIDFGNFQNCPNLSYVVFQGNQPNFGSNVFSGSPIQTIYYPSGSDWDPNNNPFNPPIPLVPYGPPPANICFPAGTPVKTDQGLVSIDKINTSKHTIQGNKIVAITRTINTDKTMVFIEKDALGKNVPSQHTIISNQHQIFFRNKMIPASKLVESYRNHYDQDNKVRFIKYTGEILYNVLLKEHNVMLVNNLIVETLNPENTIAKYYINNYDKLPLKESYEKFCELLKNKNKKVNNNVNVKLTMG